MCLNEGCQHVLINEELALHLLICDKQLVSCPDCGLSMAKDMLAHHLSEWCLYKGICCPLGCGEILPRYFVILFFSFGTLISLLVRQRKKKKKLLLAKPWLWMKQMTGTNALIEKWPRSLNVSKRIWRAGKLQTFRVLWMLKLNSFSLSIPPSVSHMCSNTRGRVSRTAPFSKKGHVAFRSIGFFGDC